MSYELKELVNNRQLATLKIQGLIGLVSKQELSKTLQMSRPTLERRLSKHNWKLNELKIINESLNF